MKVKKSVIPVAGLGTRFLPITKSVPKELLPVGTIPTLQYVIKEAVDSGIEEVILVTSKRKNQIAEYFTVGGVYEEILKELGKSSLLNELNSFLKKVKITEIYQDKPLGLGHAVLCAKDAVGKEPFVVQLPDEIYDGKVPCTKQMIDQFLKTGVSTNITQKMPKEKLSLYGIHDIAKSDGKLHHSSGVVEKPKPNEAPSDLCVAGRYLFVPEIFEVLEETPLIKGEIQLAEAMNTVAKKGQLHAFEFEGMRFDTGDKLGYVEANIYFGRKEFPNELK